MELLNLTLNGAICKFKSNFELFIHSVTSKKNYIKLFSLLPSRSVLNRMHSILKVLMTEKGKHYKWGPKPKIG